MVANIQVLRTFAALAVVWHHLQQQLELYLGVASGTWFGIAGVDVFFVISGFIMFHTHPELPHSPLAFWSDRVIRIAPPYWFATLAVVALYLAGFQPQGLKAVDVGDVLTSLGFVPDIRSDGLESPVLSVGWTLIYEMFFYFLFGLSFFLRSRLTALLALSVFFAAMGLILQLAPNLPYAVRFYMQPITLEFAAGGALAILYARIGGIPSAVARTIGFGLIAAGVVGVFVTADLAGDLVNTKRLDLRTLTLGVSAIAIVAGALVLDRGGIRARNAKLMLLGAASYTIYLLHPLAVQFSTKILASLVGLRGPDGVILLAVAGFGSAVGIGVLFYLKVEHPLHKMLKAFVGALRARYRTSHPYPACKPRRIPHTASKTSEDRFTSRRERLFDRLRLSRHG